MKGHAMRKSLALIPASLLVLAGCGTSPDTAPAADVITETPAPATEPTVPPLEAVEPTANGTSTIILEATASGPGSVHWGDVGSSNTVEIAPGEVWTKTLEDADTWDMWSVSVYGDYMDTDAVVTCRITVDGEVVDQATGTGEGGSAYCSGL